MNHGASVNLNGAAERSWASTLLDRPSAAVGLVAILQLLIWTLVPYLSATSLPLDVVSDGLSWGHEWQLGYYKHPPLPPWTVEASFDLLGNLGPFLLSQIAVSATYWLVFLTGRDLMGVRDAAIGAVLLAGVYYFSIASPEFNHNVAQMPVWAATTFCYLKAIRQERLHWWILLGISAGLGMLSKYSSALLDLTLLIHLLATPSARAQLRTVGPYAAIVVALLVFLPHAWWLAENRFAPLRYAAARAGEVRHWYSRLSVPLQFLVTQILVLLPAVAVLAIAGLSKLDRPVRNPLWAEADRFLLVIGLGPIVLSVLLSAITGFGLRTMWGMPMLNLSGLLLVRAARPVVTASWLKRFAIATAALFILFPACYVFATVIGPRLRHHPSRTGWPERAMAERLGQDWTRSTSKPLEIVAGDSWIAGLVAMGSQPRPSVFIDADYRKAPWITPGRLACEGALFVWDMRKESNWRVANFPGTRMMGEEQFAWPGRTDLKPLKLGWGILTPNPVSCGAAHE